MSELRRDRLTGRWVIIAENRSFRPNEYLHRPAPAPPTDCPFCEGHESWTPPEVAAIRPGHLPANGPGWSVRVIPNKFPTVSELEMLPPGAGRTASPPPWERRHGQGVHEVLVETPVHVARFRDLTPAAALAVLSVARDRVRLLAARPEHASVVLFENSGPESGGTLFHPHLQIIAVSEVPPRLTEEHDSALRFARDHEARCGEEAVLADEREANERVVCERPGFTAYCPFASEEPFEVRVVPHRHLSSFGALDDAEIAALASLLLDLLMAYEQVQPNGSYNLVAREFAGARRNRAEGHLHLDLLPRLIRPDGFEVGGGIVVNPVAPERAAKELRTALSRPHPAGPGEGPKG